MKREDKKIALLVTSVLFSTLGFCVAIVAAFDDGMTASSRVWWGLMGAGLVMATLAFALAIVLMLRDPS